MTCALLGLSDPTLAQVEGILSTARVAWVTGHENEGSTSRASAPTGQIGAKLTMLLGSIWLRNSGDTLLADGLAALCVRQDEVSEEAIRRNHSRPIFGERGVWYAIRINYQGEGGDKKVVGRIRTA
jgi:hypothetical protein